MPRLRVACVASSSLTVFVWALFKKNSTHNRFLEWLKHFDELLWPAQVELSYQTSDWCSVNVALHTGLMRHSFRNLKKQSYEWIIFLSSMRRKIFFNEALITCKCEHSGINSFKHWFFLSPEDDHASFTERIRSVLMWNITSAEKCI